MLNTYAYVMLIVLVHLFKMNYQSDIATEVTYDFILSVIFAIIFHSGELYFQLYLSISVIIYKGGTELICIKVCTHMYFVA